MWLRQHLGEAGVKEGFMRSSLPTPYLPAKESFSPGSGCLFPAAFGSLSFTCRFNAPCTGHFSATAFVLEVSLS